MDVYGVLHDQFYLIMVILAFISLDFDFFGMLDNYFIGFICWENMASFSQVSFTNKFLWCLYDTD